MIDLHCHILPGLDDGPPDLATSVALARAQVAVGVRTVVATPHVSPRFPGNDGASIETAVRTLDAALAAAGVPLRVLAGAEVNVAAAAELDDAALAGLRLGGGPWLLLEPAAAAHASASELACRHLLARGHRILLAHPERCPGFQRRPESLARLVASGVLVQLTAGALVGRFGPRAERLARQLVYDGSAHVVASDAHGVARRTPGLRAEISGAGFETQLGWLTEDVPAAILDGATIPARPELPRRRGFLRRRLPGSS